MPGQFSTLRTNCAIACGSRAGEIHEMFDAFGPQQPTVWAAVTTKNTNDTKSLE